jgi:hypothetical protein
MKRIKISGATVPLKSMNDSLMPKRLPGYEYTRKSCIWQQQQKWITKILASAKFTRNKTPQCFITSKPDPLVYGHQEFFKYQFWYIHPCEVSTSMK